MGAFAEVSPVFKARMAGAFWLMVFLAGSLALFLGRGGGMAFSAANIVAPLCYIAVTLLLYDLLKPVNRNLSLLAAFFGLAGCVVSVPRALAAFGLVGSLLQITGVTMRGLWGYSPLTVLAMPLAPAYVAIAVWLIVRGFDEQHRPLQAEAQGAEIEGQGS